MTIFIFHTSVSAMIIITFFLAHWFLSLFCQTFFLHRYASHKMFVLNRFWEKFFYLLTFITQGSSSLNPRAYAIMHRQHHQYSDTKNDPHSPHQSKSLWAMMTRTWRKYHEILTAPTPANITRDYPEWPLLDRISDFRGTAVVFACAYFAVYYFYAPSLWYYILLPAQIFMGFIHGSIVNWCGHKYGYQNFDNKDFSTNVLPVDFVMMGELFQNNHHKFATRPNFAWRKFEIDPTYYLILLMQKLGVLKLI